MKKIIDYHIVMVESSADFNDAVCSVRHMIQSYIKQGWQPIGSVQIQYKYGNQIAHPFTVCQTLIKYEEEDE